MLGAQCGPFSRHSDPQYTPFGPLSGILRSLALVWVPGVR